MVAVRGKQFMDIDVYEAAKQRINHILDIFDNVFQKKGITEESEYSKAWKPVIVRK